MNTSTIIEYENEILSLEQRAKDIEEERATVQGQLVQAHRRLTEAKAEAARIEREPEDIKLFGELAERVHQRLRSAPAYSPTASALLSRLDALEHSDETAATKVEAIKGMLKESEFGSIYRKDRDAWDKTEAERAARQRGG